MVLGGLLEEWVNRRRERQMAEAVAEAVSEATAKVRAEAQTEARAEGRSEGRSEGRAEAQSETDALWRAWNERQMDALGKGEPFDEPPPDISRASENGR